MSKKLNEDLKNPEQWDWESAKFVQPTKAPRTIVSVAFSRNEFQFVAETAAGLKQPVSAFIREAALQKAEGEQAILQLGMSMGNRGYVVVYGQREVFTGTLYSGRPDPEAVATS
jgi:hypothetical protein